MAGGDGTPKTFPIRMTIIAPGTQDMEAFLQTFERSLTYLSGVCCDIRLLLSPWGQADPPKNQLRSHWPCWYVSMPKYGGEVITQLNRAFPCKNFRLRLSSFLTTPTAPGSWAVNICAARRRIISITLHRGGLRLCCFQKRKDAS